jgi:RNA polymerase sigma-70 factor (ECF subfamily)
MSTVNAVPLDGPYDGAEEPALVHAAALDARAFGQLYERYVDRVYRYQRVRTDSDEDAADLTQQTFLQVLDALPKYQERGVPFSVWLFRIARNASIDSRRRTRPSVSWNAVSESGQPRSGQDVEGMVVAREDSAHLRAMIAGLDRGKREIILLRFVGELTMGEIAAVVGKSDSTVHRQLMSALAILKEQARER